MEAVTAHWLDPGRTWRRYPDLRRYWRRRQNALAQAGIRLFGGVSGNADEAVNALLAGNLGYDLMCTVIITTIMEKDTAAAIMLWKPFLPLIADTDLT